MGGDIDYYIPPEKIMKKMLGLMLGIVLLLCGCATTGSITLREDGVNFKTDIPAKMSIEKGDVKATYDTLQPSLLHDIVGATILKEVNKD